MAQVINNQAPDVAAAVTPAPMPAAPLLQETAGMPPTMAPQAAGMVNNYDMQFRVHKLKVKVIEWTKTQPVGTVLAVFPIHPSQHPWTDYISRLYNVWAGAFRIEMQPVATHFHAGRVAMVRIPPNLNPYDMSIPVNYTMFDFVSIDAKTPDPVALTPIDQRRLFYHYVGEEPVDGVWKPDDIGGYVMLIVDNMLVTSSTGVDKIDINIYMESDSFEFAQLKPLAPTSIALNPFSPGFVSPFSTEQKYALHNIAVTKLSSVPQFSTKYTLYVMDSGGKATYRLLDTNVFGPRTCAGQAKEANIISLYSPHGELNAGKYTINDHKAVDATFAHVVGDVYVCNTTCEAGPSYCRFESGAWNGLTALDTSKWFMMFDAVSKEVYNNENLVWFGTDKDEWAPQVDEVRAMWFDGRYEAVLPPGKAILYQIYNTEINAPVGYMKLYSNGLCSMKSDKNYTVMRLESLSFRVMDIVQSRDPFPNHDPPTIAGMTMMAMKRDLIIGESSRRRQS